MVRVLKEKLPTHSFLRFVLKYLILKYKEIRFQRSFSFLRKKEVMIAKPGYKKKNFFNLKVTRGRCYYS